MTLWRRKTAAALALALVACNGAGGDRQAARDGDDAEAAGDPVSREQRPSVAEALAASADHAAFVRALRSAGLLESFAGPIPYTVFAPDEAAFASLSPNLRSSLEPIERSERQIALLSHHVVAGAVTVADMAGAIAGSPEGRAELVTVTGARLRLSREGDVIVVEDGQGGRARLVEPDRVQANGVIHGIDAVLMPRS